MRDPPFPGFDLKPADARDRACVLAWARENGVRLPLWAKPPETVVRRGWWGWVTKWFARRKHDADQTTQGRNQRQ
jgi:hypothetical protein